MMTPEERAEELRYAAGCLYRVRMGTTYADLGREGVAEVVLAEVLAERARKRALGKPVGRLPRTITEMRRELENTDAA